MKSLKQISFYLLVIIMCGGYVSCVQKDGSQASSENLMYSIVFNPDENKSDSLIGHFENLKDLIKEEKVKDIFLPIPAIPAMYCDLYVRGMINCESMDLWLITVNSEGLKTNPMGNAMGSLSFLQWLRQNNQENDSDVRIYGLDMYYPGSMSPRAQNTAEIFTKTGLVDSLNKVCWDEWANVDSVAKNTCKYIDDNRKRLSETMGDEYLDIWETYFVEMKKEPFGHRLSKEEKQAVTLGYFKRKYKRGACVIGSQELVDLLTTSTSD